MPRIRLSTSLLGLALVGCGSGGSNGASGLSGAYVPKHPDSPVILIQKFDFQAGGKVAVTAFDNTEVGTYVLADGAIEITMPAGHKAHLKDVGGGCLLAVSDPGIAEAAAKDGIDVNELARYCRD